MIFTIEAMRGVVEHYRAFRVQPADCTECRYLPLSYPSDDVPEGYELMRDEDLLISQCAAHNKPLYQWLHKADTNRAAQWLLDRGNARETGTFTFPAISDEMRKDLGL